MEEYILKISTKDEKGLIYNISKVLFANNLKWMKRQMSFS